MRVSACIATRGDHDLTEIIRALMAGGVDDVVVWDNSVERNLGPYGRFAAMARAKHDIVLVQDDDVLLSPGSVERLLSAYEPDTVTSNMPLSFRPHYPDSCLVGFGAIFDSYLPERAFRRFFEYHSDMSPDAPLFLRESCRAFTVLTSRRLVDVPKIDLPWASDPDRLWKQPDHFAQAKQMLKLAREVRDAAVARH